MMGTNPFKGEDFKQILRENKNCKIDFESEEFKDKNPRSNFFL